MKFFLYLALLTTILIFLTGNAKVRKCIRYPSVNSSVGRYRTGSALYNHFVIDDRAAPGRVWNEEFTSGIR